MTKKTDDVDDFLNESPPADTKTPPPPPPAFKQTPYQRKRRQVHLSLGITEKCLPPMTRRGTAVYQLLGMDRKDVRIIGGERDDGTRINVPEKIVPAPFEFSPSYQFDDRGEEDIALRRKTMVYTNDIIVYNRAKLATPKELPDLQLDIPTFNNGQLIVDTVGNYIKYVWLELHPQNESNKWRDKSRRAEFRRVDTEYVSPYVHMMKMDLAADAENLIREMDSKTLTNLAAAFGMPVSMGIIDMRLELRQKARQNPEEVMFKTPNKSMANMLNVMHAINMGVVDWDPNKLSYFFPGDDEPFYIVPVDTKNPLEDVADYLATPEGKEAMQELESLIAYWRKT